MSPLYLFLMVTLTTTTSIGVSTDVIFGYCESENQTCADCYYKLKESLLQRDKNIQNLSLAFFPPNKNIPEFVAVTYCFNENCTNPEKWFWTHDSSYLFFPIETFQYLSMFFGKPASLFSQKLFVTLDAECNNTDHNLMKLLTQRLKNFIQRASFDPVIDDNYFARAEESNEDDLSTPKAIYILSFHIISSVLAVVIALITLIIYLNTKNWDKELIESAAITKQNKYTKSKIFSIAATSIFINVYALVLDSLAINTKLNGDVSIDEHYVHALPYYVICVDAVGALLWILCWLSACILSFTEKDKVYLPLAVSIIGPCLTLVVHIPYIAIAYLNDASYATSIFIYYTVSILAVFGTLDLSYGTCQGAIIVRNNMADEERKLDEDKTPDEKKEKYYICCKKCNTCSPSLMYITLVFLIIGFTFLVVALVCFITAALVEIPISNAYTDVSDRLVGFYQTVIIFVGAYLIYRNFFKRTPSLESVVKNRNEEIRCKKEVWDKLSKDEKLIEFYSKLADIVANYPKGPQQNDDQNPPQNDDQNPPQNDDQNPPQNDDQNDMSDVKTPTGPGKEEIQVEVHDDTRHLLDTDNK